jgi:serine/threonine protein kinase
MGCASSSSASQPGPTASGNFGRKIHVEDEYDLEQQLGEGAFGSVCAAVRKADGAQVAIKTLDRKYKDFHASTVKNEIAIMRAVEHPSCIRLLDVVEDKQSVHLVEELATGGELFERIIEMPGGHLTEKHTAALVSQILAGLSHMHAVGVVHRDLKPENLLMMSANPADDGFMQVKIADFGLSILLGGPSKGALITVCGTADYMAPEMAAMAQDGRSDRIAYDGKVFSLSV